MLKGKTSHLRLAIAPNRSTYEVENVRFIMLFKSKLCETLQEKIKDLDKEVEEVHGDLHKVHITLKDQDTLVTEP
jgi:predicted trehalose synthase